MPTNDERREVAGRLRGMDAQDHDNEVCVDQNPSGGGAFEPLGLTAGDLADLIDPTCHFLPTFDGGFGCDRCYTWFQSMETKPNYCSSCGARVVDDD